MVAAAVQLRARHPVNGRHFLGTGDDSLVARVRAGDDAAFEAIYERYHRGLLTFCRHILGSRDEAEDALQHSFVSAYKALRATDGDIALKPWLYTIARNRCLSALRTRREAAAVDDLDADGRVFDGLTAEVQRRADLRDLLDDLQRLPQEQRSALVLFEIGDQSHGEIAEVLGVRKEKVKALIFQAREALMRARSARETPCTQVREQLASLSRGAPRRSMTRGHVDRCPSCAAFELEVRRQRKALAAALPVVPTVGLKASVLGSVLGGGGAAGAGGAGAGAGGGGAVAAGGAGAGAGGGGAVAAGGAGAGAAASAGGGGAAAGGLGTASAATGATGLATAGAGAGTVASGLAAVTAKGVVAKILTTVAVAGGAGAAAQATRHDPPPPPPPAPVAAAPVRQAAVGPRASAGLSADPPAPQLPGAPAATGPPTATAPAHQPQTTPDPDPPPANTATTSTTPAATTTTTTTTTTPPAPTPPAAEPQASAPKPPSATTTATTPATTTTATTPEPPATGGTPDTTTTTATGGATAQPPATTTDPTTTTTTGETAPTPDGGTTTSAGGAQGSAGR